MHKPLSDSGIRAPDLTTILLRHSLRGSAVFVALIWVLVIFVSPNKAAAASSSAIASLLMFAVPWWLFERGRTRAATHVFLGSTLVLSLLFYWFGRGVYAPSVVLQFGVVLQAALLLGRNGVLWIAAPVLGLDLLKVVLEAKGVAVPLLFPGTPLSSWLLIAVTIVWTVPVLNAAIKTLRDSGDRLRRHVVELRETNQRLMQSEELRQLISETAPVGILVFDTEGWNVFANSFAVSRMGEQVRGMNRHSSPWILTDHSGHPIPRKDYLFARVMANGEPVHGARVAMETSPGVRLYLSISAAALRGNDGGMRGVVMAFEDVSERVEFERRHLHAQKLATMGEFAGSVAHDFNNLLTVIRGDSQLALKNGPDDPGLRTRLERIYKASDSAATLCRQLLTFARRDDVRPHALSLNDLIRGNEDLLRGMLPENVELRLELGPDVPSVMAESSLLLQVLVNLTANARDAMPSRGTLTFRTTQDPPGSVTLLAVEDTGSGMEEEVRQSVFEPFFTTKGRGKGTGLGLAIVYAIIQQFGGWVRAESKPGQGSRFVIGLPWP